MTWSRAQRKRQKRGKRVSVRRGEHGAYALPAPAPHGHCCRREESAECDVAGAKRQQAWRRSTDGSYRLPLAQPLPRLLAPPQPCHKRLAQFIDDATADRLMPTQTPAKAQHAARRAAAALMPRRDAAHGERTQMRKPCPRASTRCRLPRSSGATRVAREWSAKQRAVRCENSRRRVGGSSAPTYVAAARRHAAFSVQPRKYTPSIENAERSRARRHTLRPPG